MIYKRIPTQILVAAFTDEGGAQKCLEAVAKAAAEEKAGPITTNAAVATKGVDGKMRVKEYGKPNMVKGLLGGTVLGGVSGAALGGAALAILGPVGIGVGAIAGGAVGAPLGAVKGAMVGTVGKWTTEGMDKSKLEGLGDALAPGTSALVLVFAEIIVKKDQLEDGDLKAYGEGIDQIAEAVTESVSSNLKQGNNCAHLLVVTEDGAVATKVVVGDEVFQVNKIVMTEDEAAAAQFKATPEGAAAEAVVVTEDAIFANGVVVTEDAAIEYEVAAVQ
mmetsp:Transcript_1103/g.2573  ORF Transcript_1103/g.2573 Transcript_1103/m.2573 type:complete len:276 (+) Transcript_1103:154-981(+)|eukprot:CAMPEP_0178515512 /NCGR_PEP_ID=MMETSP0696-20121128/24596_1 /TAXON_ID=265572 /ORGANISM="Extubocellulus spinifer, Strain CCMP396" /LENGTH=275 /DNA_ID=CAMNT_0020145679 /DNA_START=93 /DNA_END=920 /DNA_ORIENTATION=-